VVRGDNSSVQIGAKTAIKDRAVIDTVSSLSSGYPADVVIGRDATVGAGAVVTSSVLGNAVQIGNGAIVCEGCVIERNSIVAAGSVVSPGTLIPANQFWAGNPATYQRDVSEEEVQQQCERAEAVWATAEDHASEFLPHGFAYVEAENAGART
jgi:carbonic anhydrase/acetyltransferase-like protein (isoleucine patch superfamily)